MTTQPYRIGETFNPDPALKKYYFLIYAIILILAAGFSIGILAVVPGIAALVITIPIIAALLFILYWLPLYYKSIVYELTPTEITWRRGVWFRQNAIVPYSRITNIDIYQGPVMRLFGISSLHIQTAGYSAQPMAELSLSGITGAEELRELVMGYVRSGPAIATESGGEIPPARSKDPLLDEIRQIRTTLERIDEKIR
ncbi:MAG: PH domain-containing protein [Methanocalculus sp. MSAO_Arc1]|uniref:PH domain-containing protein n=1 Tax=Methanocalculus TaxID=71151 RepID=UPI000FEDC21A|nr:MULTISPECIES: PH domain-containing protein [unclassified Methanocalculus]MCP1662157.1 membrane protein YdbS with pleckstrin-like domain [Methanocalculus sp. AMF5]RQD79112.1 MAG: PH domain-containing protein [Methanocalculus sp. MSAO_Arc1]